MNIYLLISFIFRAMQGRVISEEGSSGYGSAESGMMNLLVLSVIAHLCSQHITWELFV